MNNVGKNSVVRKDRETKVGKKGSGNKESGKCWGRIGQKEEKTVEKTDEQTVGKSRKIEKQ